jgi:hypothetical protein
MGINELEGRRMKKEEKKMSKTVRKMEECFP